MVNLLHVSALFFVAVVIVWLIARSAVRGVIVKEEHIITKEMIELENKVNEVITKINEVNERIGYLDSKLDNFKK